MLEKVNAAFNKWMKRLKTISIWLGTWGFIFSVVTIAGLKAAFDYDDTLVFTSPAFQKASQTGAIINSPDYWRTLNQSYDLEKVKILPYSAAWLFKITGFRVSVVTERNAVGSEALVKFWKPLVSDFYFVSDPLKKAEVLGSDRYLFYFGDSDADITCARKAGVLPVRVKRSDKSSNKVDYRPGTLREWVIPLSEY